MTTQFVTFTLADELYGIEVQGVQEVLPARTFARVPLAPRDVAGLISLRGQVVLAVDLRAQLGLPAAAPDAERMMVVVRVGHEVVSLLVDQIGEVVDVEDDQFESPPQTLPVDRRAAIRGSYKLPQRLLLALDVDAVAAA